jgi:transposase
MTDTKDLRSRLVVGERRDGRREYDEDARDELVRLCLRPGVSIARTAMEHDVNPNQLRKWITRYRQRLADDIQRRTAVTDGVPIDLAPVSRGASTFIPVVASASVAAAALTPAPVAMAIALHVRLPNGVELDLGEAGLADLTTLIQMLGRLPCSGSTND